ncbi:c-type cytochrome [Coralloluteibacterium stylophorae]
MSNVSRPSRTLLRLALLLLPAAASLGTALAADGASASPEAIEAGKKLYFSSSCNACHGGTGGGGMCPPLTNDIWIYGEDDETLHALIKNGTPGMEAIGKTRVGQEKVVGQMPPFGTVLKDEDIDNLIAFVHSLKKTEGASGGAK